MPDWWKQWAAQIALFLANLWSRAKSDDSRSGSTGADGNGPPAAPIDPKSKPIDDPTTKPLPPTGGNQPV